MLDLCDDEWKTEEGFPSRRYKGQDLTGHKYGRLTVLSLEYSTKKKQYHWRCKCDCGNITHASEWQLTTSNSKGKKSCGCLAHDILVRRSTTHCHSHDPLYVTWRNMKTRCYNHNYELYHRYGGRGIKICEEWLDFDHFYKWSIENGYAKGLSIDRIDNDKDYSPDNCRWTTPTVQARNTRRSKFVEYNGQLKTVAEWAEEYGVTYHILSSRLYRGWSMDDAINIPAKTQKAHA